MFRRIREALGFGNQEEKQKASTRNWMDKKSLVRPDEITTLAEDKFVERQREGGAAVEREREETAAGNVSASHRTPSGGANEDRKALSRLLGKASSYSSKSTGSGSGRPSHLTLNRLKGAKKE